MGSGDDRRERIDLTGMLISCDDCKMQGTDACADCVVTYLLDRPDGAVVFDATEERALREMNRAGLLPPVKWEGRSEAG
ncbi:MAG: hypothetical protein ACRDH5_09275 [bacterium]